MGGHTICAACAAKVEAEQKDPSHSAFTRGILYGAGAALLCCLGYAAIIIITDMEFALVSILVGYLVGSAVRKGSAGLGGRRCQIAAVVLTYLAINLSLIPVVFEKLMFSDEIAQTEGAAANEKGATDDKGTVTLHADGSVEPSGDMGGVMMTLVGIALAAPFLNMAEGVGGALGILILVFGLQRAWAVTGRDERVVSGPFQPQEAVPAG